jgi:hypothetical protein
MLAVSLPDSRHEGYGRVNIVFRILAMSWQAARAVDNGFRHG